MENKKIGILKNNSLERKDGNFEPDNSYTAPTAKVLKSSKDKKGQSVFANQQESIKIPTSAKYQLEALKTLTKTKFDYEIVQLLIDNYTNSFGADKMKKFKFLLEIAQDE